MKNNDKISSKKLPETREGLRIVVKIAQPGKERQGKTEKKGIFSRFLRKKIHKVLESVAWLKCSDSSV